MWISKQLNPQHLPYPPNPQPPTLTRKPHQRSISSVFSSSAGMCRAQSTWPSFFLAIIMEFSLNLFRVKKKLGLDKKKWEKTQKMMETKNIVLKLHMDVYKNHCQND